MYLDGSQATYQADRQVIDFIMIIILSSYSLFTSSPLSIRQQTNRRMNGWMEGSLFLRRICLHFIFVAFVECTERVVTRAKRSLGLTIFEEAVRGRKSTGPGNENELDRIRSAFTSLREKDVSGMRRASRS